MDLVLSWAEQRRAAGIATPLLTPIVRLPPVPERTARVCPSPLSIPPSPPPVAAEVAKSDGDRCAAAALTATAHAAWDAWLDRTVKEIMGSEAPATSAPVAQDDDGVALAYLESAAAYVERVYRLRVSDVARDVEMASAAPVGAEPPALPAAPVTLSGAEPATEQAPEPFVRRPAAMTREVLAALRDGITHKDIKGDREAELIRRYQAGDRHAGEILLRAHAKFIAYWAHKYGGGMHDLSPEDLLSEAQIGFLDGVARFDPAAGWQLTTYAIHRIRSTVQRAKANTGNAIRIPVGLREGGAKGAKALPGDNKRVMAMRAALGMCSLDAPIGDDDGGTLGDMTAGDDDTEATVADNEWNEETGAVLAEIMAALPEKFADVLRRRADGETLDQVGSALGVSRERARQLEVEARARARRAAVDLGLADDEVLVEHVGKVVEAPEIRLSRDGCERCGHAGHFTKTCDKWANRRFGTWVVVRGAPCAKTAAGSPTGTQVVVRCSECNGEKVARAAHLDRGIATACECVQRKRRTR